MSSILLKDRLKLVFNSILIIVAVSHESSKVPIENSPDDLSLFLTIDLLVFLTDQLLVDRNFDDLCRYL